MLRYAGLSVTEAMVKHQLLGVGRPVSTQFLLNDEVVEVLGKFFHAEVGTPDGTIVLPPLFLTALLGIGNPLPPQPPKPSTIRRFLAGQESEESLNMLTRNGLAVGVVHLPPHHWITVAITFRSTHSILRGRTIVRASLTVFDSLTVSDLHPRLHRHTEMARQRIDEALGKTSYFLTWTTKFVAAPRQQTWVDCGMIALLTVRELLQVRPHRVADHEFTSFDGSIPAIAFHRHDTFKRFKEAAEVNDMPRRKRTARENSRDQEEDKDEEDDVVILSVT